MHTIAPAPGSKKEGKRLGRGIGSGLGKTSGKGHKGQWARSGGGVRPGFEGGQMPLIRRLPKRGFTNTAFKKEYAVINLRDLEKFNSGATVDLQALVDRGLVKQTANLYGVKVLGAGTLSKKLTVKAAKYSASAEKAIKKAGGTADIAKPEAKPAAKPEPKKETKPATKPVAKAPTAKPAVEPKAATPKTRPAGHPAPAPKK
jgi:large subunit ribosomal protein L15